MNKNSLATSIILFILAAALLAFSILNSNKTAQNATTTASTTVSTLETIQKQVSPYEAKDVMNKAVIMTNFKNSSASSTPTSTFEKTLVVSGTVTDGYL